MNITTACPLDCYDACGIQYQNSKIKAQKIGYTSGFLCPHMNHYEKFKIIKMPKYKGTEITMSKALELLVEMFKESKPEEILHYIGSGNFALMQEVTEHFFASFGATLSNGSLCDGAGEAGIINGRGSNKNMPTSEIKKSDVIIFWGRNPHTTSSHLLTNLRGKKIIVIDPVKTKIAKNADLFIQIKPHTDLYLAMLLSRFLHIDNGCDEDYLKEYAPDYEEYYELTQTLRIKSIIDDIGVSLGQIGKLLELVKEKKVAIVCGVGIQKYVDGADIIRAIDAFAVMLGLFGKEGCGVAYLGASQENISSPFYKKAKRVSKVDTEFSEYKTVFIQGANPLSQMPDTLRVKKSISKSKNIVYFGLYENETSEMADLIIPAKSFLCKDDVRTSYSHNYMLFMDKVMDSKYGISEYELSAYLCSIFNIDIESEEFYLKHFKSFATKNKDSTWSVKNREEIPYKNGFDTKNKKFLFLDELEDYEPSKNFHLITPKSVFSLNSQFKCEKNVYIHSSLGFKEGDLLNISSKNGCVKLEVKLNDDLRDDCVLIFSGTKGVNNLTSSKHSYEGKSAIYQQNIVNISKV